MNLVEFHQGQVSVRWTWLPYWLGSNRKLRIELEMELRDVALLNMMTESPADQARLHRALCRSIQRRWPGFQGLEAYLGAASHVELPPEAV